MSLFRRRHAPRHSGAGLSPSVRRQDWRTYEAVAEEYERVLAAHTTVPYADLLAIASVAAGDRVLDVGTGTGAALGAADDMTGDRGLAVGVDRSPSMLALGRRARPAVRLVAGDVVDLPFHDETFDVVTANLALATFKKLDTSLFDMKRVLKVGGRVAVSSWGAGEDELSKTWRMLAEEAVGLDSLKSALREATPWTHALEDPKRFETTLRDAGFRPVHVESRRYRLSISREDYIAGHEAEASGRFIRAMLGDRLWGSFRDRVRTTFAERFPEQLVDFRDVLLASGIRPR